MTMYSYIPTFTYEYDGRTYLKSFSGINYLDYIIFYGDIYM